MSIRPTFNTLMVNVKTVHAAFYNDSVQGNLADFMMRVKNDNRGNLPQNVFAKLRISTKHRGYMKKHTILRVALREGTPRRHKIDCENLGGMVTIEEYFKRSEYRVRPHGVTH